MVENVTAWARSAATVTAYGRTISTTAFTFRRSSASSTWVIKFLIVKRAPKILIALSFHRIDPVSCTTSDDDDNEFFDAQELSGQDGTFSLNMPANIGEANGESSSESEELNSCETEPQSNHPSQVTIISLHTATYVKCILLKCFTLGEVFFFSRNLNVFVVKTVFMPLYWWNVTVFRYFISSCAAIKINALTFCVVSV